MSRVSSMVGMRRNEWFELNPGFSETDICQHADAIDISTISIFIKHYLENYFSRYVWIHSFKLLFKNKKNEEKKMKAAASFGCCVTLMWVPDFFLSLRVKNNDDICLHIFAFWSINEMKWVLNERAKSGGQNKNQYWVFEHYKNECVSKWIKTRITTAIHAHARHTTWHFKIPLFRAFLFMLNSSIVPLYNILHLLFFLLFFLFIVLE